MYQQNTMWPAGLRAPITAAWLVIPPVQLGIRLHIEMETASSDEIATGGISVGI